MEKWRVAVPQILWEMYTPDINGNYDPGLRQRNLKRIITTIDGCFLGTARNSPPFIRLILFPEFSLGGWTSGQTNIGAQKEHVAITIPGPETEVLAQKAIQRKVYIALGIMENDSAWPNLLFNSAIIINPKGKIILHYRKWNANLGTNPHEIWDEYIAPITGQRDPFPVVDTEIGRLAVSICADIYSPELHRAYALKGAEVLCHLTAGSPQVRIAMYRTRAADNSMYIAVTNMAGNILADGLIDHSRTLRQTIGVSGRSSVYDYEGNPIAEATGDASQIVIGTIDIASLRANGPNLTDLRTEPFAPFYNQSIIPPNIFLNATQKELLEPKKVREQYAAQARQNREKLYSFYSENDVK